MDPILKVNGVDLTDYFLAERASITSVITRQIDTASIEIEGAHNDVHNNVHVKNEVVIENNGERIFGGYICNISYEVEGITRIYKCDCQDYQVLLDTAIINELYEDMTDDMILKSAFATYLPDIKINAETDDPVPDPIYVYKGETIDRLICNRWTLRKLVDYMAELSGYDWYVDYNKYLHYFKTTDLLDIAATFGLSSSPDKAATPLPTYPFKMSSYSIDGSQIINRVFVRGGYELSHADGADFYLEGNNEKLEFLLPYRLHKPEGFTSIQVRKWNGTPPSGNPNNYDAALNVGIDNIDNFEGNDVLYNYQEKLIKFKPPVNGVPYPPKSNPKAIWIVGRYERPILAKMQDDDSYKDYGRWYDGIVVDKDIDSTTLAILKATSVLAEHKYAREQGQVETTKDGLISGMSVKITDSVRGIDDYYLIHRVAIKFLGGGTVVYQADFGEYNPDLVDMLLNLKRNKAYETKHENDVLNELYKVYGSEEEFALSDYSITKTETQPPYIVPLKTGFWKAS